MDGDILQEVSKNEILKVLETLKKEWPKHFLLHQYISVLEENKQAKLESAQTLYRFGNIEDGVYILKTSFLGGQKPCTHIFIYTASDDPSSMLRVLMESNRIPWTNKERIYYEIVSPQFWNCVTQAAASKGVDLQIKTNLMLWVPPEVEVDYGMLPSDIDLRYLDISHAPEIDRNWPHTFSGSQNFLAQQIKLNFGLGLFRKSDNKLLSSCLTFHSGGMFVLFTDPECRGKGYGEIIVRNMVKEIRLRGRTPFGTILLENTPSLNLFRKVGFKDYMIVKFYITAE